MAIYCRNHGGYTAAEDIMLVIFTLTWGAFIWIENCTVWVSAIPVHFQDCHGKLTGLPNCTTRRLEIAGNEQLSPLATPNRTPKKG
jgi:hypothetical protein